MLTPRNSLARERLLKTAKSHFSFLFLFRRKKITFSPNINIITLRDDRLYLFKNTIIFLFCFAFFASLVFAFAPTHPYTASLCFLCTYSQQMHCGQFGVQYLFQQHFVMRTEPAEKDQQCNVNTPPMIQGGFSHLFFRFLIVI